MAQSWNDLLFAHWRVDPGSLSRLVPAPLELDTFGGEAYVGVVAFKMQTVRFAGCPPVLGTSTFAELNLRTYVRFRDRAGVFFLSLDAANPLARAIGRRLYGLPYLRARVSLERSGPQDIRFACAREDRTAEFRAVYGAAGPVVLAGPGSLEHWLTERYCFYTLDRCGAALRTDVHHAPWPLQPGSVEVSLNSTGGPPGLRLDGPPLAHFSFRQDVVAWTPVPVGPGRGDQAAG